MRLTLRTLLAWLDDTLKPKQVKEIGSQVAENPFAQELKERIHRVSRQRRLSVPGSSGPDSVDPNVVASYLDNDLDSEAVADYEKQCLNSPVKLAEVASVHQILSLLGQKVKVPAEAKSRIYQLVKGREAAPRRSPEARSSLVSEPLTRPIPSWVDPNPIQRSWVERFGLFAAMLALISIAISTASWSLRTPPPAPAPTTTAMGEPAANQAVGSAPAIEEAHGRIPGGAPAIPDDSAPVEDGLAVAADSTKNAGASGPVTAAKANEAGPGSASKAMVSAAGATGAPSVKVPAGASGLSDAMGGILLRYNGDLSEWERIVGPTPVNQSDRLLCLWPFRGGMTLRNLALTMIGEAEIRILSLPSDKIPAIELLQGRLLLRDAPAGSLKVGFAGRMITLEVTPSTVIGLERTGQQGYGKTVLEPPALSVFCTHGEATVSVDEKRESLKAVEQLLIDAGKTVSRAAVDSPPAWVSESEFLPLERRLGEQFSRMFHPGRPVLTEIVAASESDSSEIKQLAILALKSLGDLSLLVPTLSRQGDAIARKAALAAIRAYMALGPDAAGRVHDQLAEEFGDDTAPFVEKMLVGYSPKEASDPGVYERLVGAIEPEQQSVGVRELAIDSLKQLTGRDDLGYNPDQPEGKGLIAWKELLRERKLHDSTTRAKTN